MESFRLILPTLAQRLQLKKRRPLAVAGGASWASWPWLKGLFANAFTG